VTPTVTYSQSQGHKEHLWAR